MKETVTDIVNYLYKHFPEFLNGKVTFFFSKKYNELFKLILFPLIKKYNK